MLRQKETIILKMFQKNTGTGNVEKFEEEKYSYRQQWNISKNMQEIKLQKKATKKKYNLNLYAPYSVGYCLTFHVLCWPSSIEKTFSRQCSVERNVIGRIIDYSSAVHHQPDLRQIEAWPLRFEKGGRIRNKTKQNKKKRMKKHLVKGCPKRGEVFGYCENDIRF